MLKLDANIISQITGGKLVVPEGAQLRSCRGMVRDSREVKEGNIFLCIPGERVDGHNFASSAFKSGAACCITQRELQNPLGPYVITDDVISAAQKLAKAYRDELNIPIIGIVGSVGKTTAKELTASVLGARFNVLKTPANLNNELGVPLTVMSIGEEHDAAVIEMGISNFGEMDRLAAIVRPDVCVFTRVGHAHLEFLGDLSGVLRAKAEVFPHMPREGLAVFNGDDDYLAAYNPGIERLLCGTRENCDIRADCIRNLGDGRMTFDICSGEVRFNVTVNAFGPHIAADALLAAAVGMHCGLTPEEITLGLASYMPIDGRAKTVKIGNITLINDCYNANPDSMSASLRALAGLGGRSCAILGDMKELGKDEIELHRAIGRETVELGIECVIAAGPLAEHIYEARLEAKPEAESEYYENAAQIIEKALPIDTGISNILIKASHSMRFESIVDAIIKDAK